MNDSYKKIPTQIGGVVIALAMVGCATTAPSANFTIKPSEQQRVDANSESPVFAFINMPELLKQNQSRNTKDEMLKKMRSFQSTNLIVLTDGVIYANEKLDLTDDIIADGFQVLNNTKRQLSKIPTELKVGFVNIPAVLENAPQAEKAKKRLEQEFSLRDKQLVAQQKEINSMDDGMDKDTATRDAKDAQNEFSDDFNVRRNLELRELQSQVVEVIRGIAKDQNYDLLLTDGVIYAGNQIDVTAQVTQGLTDGSPVLNNTQRQLSKIPLKVGYVNILPVVEKARQPNQELKELQSQIVEVIRGIAKDQNYDLLLTDGVIYAGGQFDLTDQVQKKLSARHY
jgi:outer membrane protein